MKEQLNLTSMIDMLTILLVFMITNYASQVFTNTESSGVQPPKAAIAGAIESKFMLSYDGKELKLNKESLDWSKIPKDAVLVLEASRSLPFSDIEKVLKNIEAQGFAKVELAAVPGEVK